MASSKDNAENNNKLNKEVELLREVFDAPLMLQAMKLAFQGEFQYQLKPLPQRKASQAEYQCCFDTTDIAELHQNQQLTQNDGRD